MELRDLIPKNKFDDSNIAELNGLTDEEMRPIVYDLLMWLQDYNWPIADKVLRVLLKREEIVFSYITKILLGDDLMWKIWILELLVPTFSQEHKNLLKVYISALYDEAPPDEDGDALKEAASKYYKTCFNKELI